LKVKFIYTGIRVKNLEKSIDFYTKILGMKVVGRSEIPVADGTVVNLHSEEGGFELELNYYNKTSKYAKKYVEGEALDHRGPRCVPRFSKERRLQGSRRHEDGEEPLGLHQGPERDLDRDSSLDDERSRQIVMWKRRWITVPRM
jgi:catechol 2,3-dioxygenase-like lactoylglutathione lyase family enzyme